MKHRTVTVREGELLGPVDWDYNFRQHFDSMCSPDYVKDKRCAEAVALLRNISDSPEGARIVTSGGYAYDVYSVGMYDGWPYWKPTPAVFRSGVLGPEWTFFYEIHDVKRVAPQTAQSHPEGPKGEA